MNEHMADILRNTPRNTHGNRFRNTLMVALLLLTAAHGARAIPWLDSLDSALAESQQTSRPVLLFVTGGAWCDPCVWLEENSLATDSIRSLVRVGFVPVRLLDTDPGWEQYGVRRLPTIVVLSSDGSELGRVAGAATAEMLQAELAPLASARQPASSAGSVAELPSLDTGPAATTATTDATGDPPQPVPPQRAEGEHLRGAVFRIGDKGTLWNDGGAFWYSQDAGLPPRLEEYDRDEVFLYLRDRASATLLGVPVARTGREVFSVLWKWDVETRRWEEAAELERID
jgi:hypothetical protein